MNNLSSYCGLVDAKIRVSDKDLSVILWTHDFNKFNKIFFRKCSFIVDTQDAKCSDVRVHMDRNYSEPFNLRLYYTQNECTIPSMDADQSDDFVLLAENLNVSPVNKSVSMDSVSMENLCGLVNLVLIMSNSSEPYIEHLVTPVFINCSSVDFKVEAVGGDSNNSIETVTPGEKNPFKKTQFRITTGRSNQTTTVFNFSKKDIRI